MNQERMDGSVIVITGGGSGMGAAMAKDSAGRGAGIAILDLDEARGSAVANSIADVNGKAVYKHVDVTDKQAVGRAVDEVEQELGAITSWILSLIHIQCEHYDFLGSRSDGGFAEYVKVPEENLVIMPEQVKPETAAFLEPISVALHVVSNTGVNFGDDVVVFGLGAIGIFVAQWAKAFGAAHVFAVDLDPKKVDIARQLGLTDAICGSVDEVRDIVEKVTNGTGCDVVFEASGAPAVFNQAMQLLKQNGRFGPVGRPVKDLTVFVKTYETILRKQLTIKGTWSFEFKRFPHNAWDISLEALQKGIIQTDAIISHRFPLAKTKEAVDLMAEKKEFFYKILIVPNEGTLNIKHIHDKDAS